MFGKASRVESVSENKAVVQFIDIIERATGSASAVRVTAPAGEGQCVSSVLCVAAWRAEWRSARGREMGQQGAPCCHHFCFQKLCHSEVLNPAISSYSWPTLDFSLKYQAPNF